MQEQEIRDWCVTGEDQILGNVHNRPGHADGETIITSSVLQVRLLGDAKIPMAVTESGSRYWLGTPSRRFGLAKAEAFVQRLSARKGPVDVPRDAGDRATVLPALADLAAVQAAIEASRASFGPTLAVKCVQCGAAAVATLSDEVSSINAAGGISVDDPCPQCGGNLAARPGRYRLNDATQALLRIGDFEPLAPVAQGERAPFPPPRIVRSAK